MSPDLLALLASGPDGLSTDEVDRRRRACGLNRLERIRRRPLLGRFLEQFGTFFAVLLWIAGGFAVLAGMPELGWTIFAVIIVNLFLSRSKRDREAGYLFAKTSLSSSVVRAAGLVRICRSSSPTT